MGRFSKLHLSTCIESRTVLFCLDLGLGSRGGVKCQAMLSEALYSLPVLRKGKSSVGESACCGLGGGLSEAA